MAEDLEVEEDLEVAEGCRQQKVETRHLLRAICAYHLHWGVWPQKRE